MNIQVLEEKKIDKRNVHVKLRSLENIGLSEWFGLRIWICKEQNTERRVVIWLMLCLAGKLPENNRLSPG